MSNESQEEVKTDRNTEFKKHIDSVIHLSSRFILLEDNNNSDSDGEEYKYPITHQINIDDLILSFGKKFEENGFYLVPEQTNWQKCIIYYLKGKVSQDFYPSQLTTPTLCKWVVDIDCKCYVRPDNSIIPTINYVKEYAIYSVSPRVSAHILKPAPQSITGSVIISPDGRCEILDRKYKEKKLEIVHKQKSFEGDEITIPNYSLTILFRGGDICVICARTQNILLTYNLYTIVQKTINELPDYLQNSVSIEDPIICIDSSYLGIGALRLIISMIINNRLVKFTVWWTKFEELIQNIKSTKSWRC